MVVLELGKQEVKVVDCVVWGLESCAQTVDPVPKEVTELWILERMELERISPVERVV